MVKVGDADDVGVNLQHSRSQRKMMMLLFCVVFFGISSLVSFNRNNIVYLDASKPVIVQDKQQHLLDQYSHIGDGHPTSNVTANTTNTITPSDPSLILVPNSASSNDTITDIAVQTDDNEMDVLVYTNNNIVPVTKYGRTNATCIVVSGKAGLGNKLLMMLYNALHNTWRRNEFPCVCPITFGIELGQLFANLNMCQGSEFAQYCSPSNYKEYCHGRHQKEVVFTFDDARHVIKDGLPLFPELLKLNATYIDYVFEQANTTFRLQDLVSTTNVEPTYCSIHLRFGDYYTRYFNTRHWTNWTEEETTKQLKQRRSCKELDNVGKCYKKITEEINHKYCPNFDLPVFVASDLNNFTRYYCDYNHTNKKHRPRQRKFMMACNDDQLSIKATHINDMPLLNHAPTTVNNGDEMKLNPQALPGFYALLSDWLVLALSTKMTRHVGSTFSETANYDYYV